MLNARGKKVSSRSGFFSRVRRIASMSSRARAKFSGKAVLVAWFCSAAAFAQYKAGPAGAPPSDVAAPIRQVLQESGLRITNNGSGYCEIWLRSRMPAVATPSAQNVTLPGIATGALVGLIHFDQDASDRRGQKIQAGLYTLRYAAMPANSDHLGASPQRDFLLLLRAIDDKDPDSTPKFDTLVSMSRRATGNSHPAVLSAWKADGEATAFSQEGDDWVLETKVGDTPIAVILIGIAGS